MVLGVARAIAFRLNLRGERGRASRRDEAALSRRTPRHTTHHKDLPEHVTITRLHHPFEGKTLPVFGLRRHQGKLHLILILPNGSRSLIPAEWTNLDAFPQSPPAKPKPTHLGSVRDLLQALAVVDALLRRRLPSHGSDGRSVGEENHSVATPSGQGVCLTFRFRSLEC